MINPQKKFVTLSLIFLNGSSDIFFTAKLPLLSHKIREKRIFSRGD